MRTRFSCAAGVAAACLLAGCGAEPPAPTTAATTASPAEQACLRDVASTAGRTDVRIVRSSFSQAGTEVIVGVGTTGQWRCIGYQDGTTAGIASLTDEGLL
jgi:hypothetical protein